MLFSRKTKKRRKPTRKKDSFFKFINFPIAVLSLITLFFLSSFIYEIGFNEKTASPDITLEELLKSKSNSYEIKTGQRIKIEVLNGCGQGKIAEMYQRFLRDKGFDVMDAKNAPSFNHINSKILIHSGDKEMANYLSELMGINDSLVNETRNQDKIIHLTLIIGKDFNSLESYDSVARHYPVF